MYFDAKEFGKRLHDVRTSRGITQEELAVRLGLASKQHVSRMENGERSCSIDLLIELTIFAGVSFNKIFAKLGSDMKKPDAITCIEADPPCQHGLSSDGQRAKQRGS